MADINGYHFQMGHVKGKGLGKNLQGIYTPVEAAKRRGKGAVGYHGSERTDRSLVDFPVQVDSEEEEEKQFQDQVSQWKKGTVSKTFNYYKLSCPFNFMPGDVLHPFKYALMESLNISCKINNFIHFKINNLHPLIHEVLLAVNINCVYCGML